jgi:formylglycine-generating enzyme required for sulfatase activity
MQQQMMDMNFAWIPPGTLARENAVVTISKGFYMGVFPVTQAQFKAVMGYNPAIFTSDKNRPVEMVNWFDAQDFCKKLTELTGKRIWLPTEAEWEYACRAGAMEFHGGNGEEALKKVGWYAGNGNQTTNPVGKLAPNAFGLYDMHGNVWEWCLDWYGDYPKGNLTDPKSPDAGDARVLRGGSWSTRAEYCLAAYRFWFAPALRDHNVGFRVCFRLD